MSIQATGRTVDGVTILDLAGRITLGEGSKTLREMVRGLVGEGKKNILLNMSEVSYIDSSGLGELVGSFTTVSNAGGTLKLLSLTKRVKDLLQIEKLYTVFDVHDVEADAVRSFPADPGTTSLHCRCPLCGFWSRPPLMHGLRWQPQSCPACGSEFTVEPMAVSSPGMLLVRTIKTESYASESCEVLCGAPFLVRVHGRLTMFSGSALKKIWKAVPNPRRVMFDLQTLTELDLSGAKALMALLDEPAENARVTVSLEGLASQLVGILPQDARVYRNRKAALAGLGDLSDTPVLLASTGQF